MATVPRDFNVVASKASGGGLKVIDVSDKPLKSNVVRQGKQVPAVALDQKIVDMFVTPDVIVSPTLAPRVVSQSIAPGIKVRAASTSRWRCATRSDRCDRRRPWLPRPHVWRRGRHHPDAARNARRARFRDRGGGASLAACRHRARWPPTISASWPDDPKRNFDLHSARSRCRRHSVQRRHDGHHRSTGGECGRRLPLAFAPSVVRRIHLLRRAGRPTELSGTPAGSLPRNALVEEFDVLVMRRGRRRSTPMWSGGAAGPSSNCGRHQGLSVVWISARRAR